MAPVANTAADPANRLSEELRASLRRGLTPTNLGSVPSWTRLDVVHRRAPSDRPEALGAVVLDLVREAVEQLGGDDDVRAARAVLGLDGSTSAQRLTQRRETAAAILSSTSDSFRKHHEPRLLRELAARVLEIDAGLDRGSQRLRADAAGRDVFICHAHVDKDCFARPLAAALAKEGISCWVDEAQILPGDSLFKAINAGLSGARQVVVLLTEAFLGRAWTERELEAATSLELDAGHTLVVPVLAVPRTVFIGRYPLLAGKLAVDWQEGPKRIAELLAQRFGRQPARDWVVDHPQSYIGPIWTRLTPAAGRWSTPHQVALRWGPFIWRGEVRPTDEPVSLTHHKERPDQAPLHVEVNPPAIVTVGQGRAPDAATQSIEEGWTRAAGWAFSIEERRHQREDYERNAERARWLERLRQEYVLTHDDLSPGLLAGTELPPRQWLRHRAEELGVSELIDDLA